MELREKPALEKLLKDAPVEYFSNILLYIDTLDYASIPDYDHVAAQLEASLEAYNLKYADPPDWDTMMAYLGPRYEKTLSYKLQCKERNSSGLLAKANFKFSEIML
ncbi:hypothetical protein OESDEN_16028 [Oesophagostomum dentatum]|uniref:Uncharacterized protein n=1 Tax=Oesophagostomum dentatum TaxID=61180 RepID=A0A0B1SK52_OESDE|nr:hypothetical protein OESDEN_16028 [Oesophagostomum dentatum]